MDLQLTRQNITANSFARYVSNSRYQMVPTNTDPQALECLAVSNAFGGEAGELQNVVKKIIKGGVFLQDSDLHEKFVLEAGDALHYLVSLIQLAGYSVEEIMARNVQKLDARKQAKFEAQSTTILAKTPS